ncbi:hypothetical protein CYMTET_27234 [Cymbomonas tetramitiformis]|uniref:Uncharacterized protein n=1 Tax=Cymbomonas tetramitiformis TaxID=36881 RepID=A0AAE0FQT1_9CHLO|nr:hypothetical protein CYMTET_27234 [Cymbomonas tetramitiformis]
MLPVFHDVLQDGIKKFLASSDPATNKPRFFALAADKVTELRRTGQLVGKWSLPDILLADPPVVEGHDKVGITDNIHTNVLQNQYKFASEELKQQLTGGGFDGQYSKLGVLAGVTDLLEHVKDLSLMQQTVNTLPWEVARKEDALIELFDRDMPNYKHNDKF